MLPETKRKYSIDVDELVRIDTNCKTTLIVAGRLVIRPENNRFDADNAIAYLNVVRQRFALLPGFKRTMQVYRFWRNGRVLAFRIRDEEIPFSSLDKDQDGKDKKSCLPHV